MTRALISTFIAVVLILFIAKVRTQDVRKNDETEFKYNDGPSGPAHLGEIKDEWKSCENRTRQSPIELVPKEAKIFPNPGILDIIYHLALATLINRGHNIMVSWSKDADSINIEGKTFNLLQFHWHSLTEHTLDGRQPHPLELHLVHKVDDGEIAVIGIIYKYGQPDHFLKKLMEEPLGMVNPDDIEFDINKYYRYDGSLTTRPCTEGVIWTMIYKGKTVWKEQVMALKSCVQISPCLLG